MLSLLFAVTVSLSQMAEADYKELKTLADFHSAQPDLVWTAVNDNVMGGRSSGGFAITGGRLVFRGEINTDGGGFASIRTEPQQLDIGSHDGLKLKVRGDGRTYRFRVATAGSDFAYMADFSTRRRMGDHRPSLLDISAQLARAQARSSTRETIRHHQHRLHDRRQTGWRVCTGSRMDQADSRRVAVLNAANHRYAAHQHTTHDNPGQRAHVGMPKAHKPPADGRLALNRQELRESAIAGTVS